MSEFAHIIKVRVLNKDDHWLRLWFEDGAIIEVDVWPLLARGEAFEHIRSNRALFEEVRADGWTIAWPGNVDLSPDMLYGKYEPASSTRFERRVVHAGLDSVVSDASLGTD
jgi:Protein of unknown function (DUF2442)